MLYLDIPSPSQLDRLAETRSPAAVTIYLATTPVTQDAETSRISLKNHRREALEQLEAAGAPKRSIWPVGDLLASLDDDEDFWAHQARSLAVLVTPERMRTFRLANRLQDQVHVSDRFHLKPLLRATSFSNNAWVLALSAGDVRLIAVPAEGPAEKVRVPDLPRDANDALGLATLTKRPPARVQGMEGRNLRLRQYARMVEDAVSRFIGDTDRPLIVAAADPLREMFMQQSDNPALVSEAIVGNPDQKSEGALAEEARPILTRLQEQKVAALRELYSERVGARRAISDLAQIARAATAGAVDTLMIDMESAVPGTLDAEGRITLADESGAESYGVADAVALRVLRNGGRVMPVRAADLPDANSPVAAILRYPM